MSVVDTGTETSSEEFTAEIAPQPPKRRGRQPYPRDENGNIIRPDGSVKPAAKRTKTSLEAQIDNFVTLINLLVAAFKPGYQLDPVEQKMLVKALDQQAQVSPRFRKYLEQITQVGGGVNLLGVVVIIVGRRIARANILPIPEDAPVTAEQIDNMGGAILYAMSTGVIPGTAPA